VDASADLLPKSARQEPEHRMRVLAAEDNPICQSMLRALLTMWGYDVAVARDGLEACRILESPAAPRLAILDWMMPGMDGVELCRRVRGAGREPYIYILLLTARTESQDLVEGMEAGADDYLTKPFNAHELRVRLRAGRRLLDLQEELMLAREALRDQATHDSLTGLLNRAAILDALQNELARAARGRHPVALLMADLDRFKLVNDAHGHMVGSELLALVGRRLQKLSREQDLCFRYGGDEFVILMPETEAGLALDLTKGIHAALMETPFGMKSGLTLKVSASVGLASFPGDGTRMHEIIGTADARMYAVKRHGRGQVRAS